MTTQVLNEKDSVVLSDQDLFDANGRCIPRGLSAEVHVKTRHYFQINQPKVDYAEIYARISRHLGSASQLTAEAFAARSKKILQGLESDARTQNIVKGVGVPFFIPKSAPGDIGEKLESMYIPAATSAYSEMFPSYGFKNHYKETLKNRFTVVPGTRHDKLVSLTANEDVVGYYFPCLLEYSVPATRELVQKLSDKFMLAGGFDTFAAVIAAPDLLFNKDFYPPLLWLAALEGEKPTAGYHFEAYGYNLTFNRKPHFDKVAEYWAAGLVVLG